MGGKKDGIMTKKQKRVTLYAFHGGAYILKSTRTGGSDHKLYSIYCTVKKCGLGGYVLTQLQGVWDIHVGDYYGIERTRPIHLNTWHSIKIFRSKNH